MEDSMKGLNNSCLHIASNGKYYHPVATNHFTVTMMLPENLINYADPKKKNFSKDDSQLTLKIANENIIEPSFSQQSLSYKKGNLTIEFPGSIDSFSSTASFHVFVTKSAYDILYSLKMAAGNHITGDIGNPDDYWFTTQIDIGTGNKGTLVGTWIWHNCWISNLQGVTFDNGSNTPKTASVTIKYFRPEWEDKYEPTM